MYNCMSGKKFSHTAVVVLAALSISVGNIPLAVAKSSSQRHHSQVQANGELIAGFPFRKNKSDAKTDATKNVGKNSEKDSANSAKGTTAESAADVTQGEDATTSPDSDKTAKSPEKTKDETDSVDKKRAKADQKAAAKAQSDREDAEKETAKLAKKAEKQKSKVTEKGSEKGPEKGSEKASAKTKNAKAENEGAEKAKQINKVEKENKVVERENKAVEKQASTESGAVANQTRRGYVADTALLSLLNDLARALKDPAEQAKLGDENQKFVVAMALDILTRALETRNDANRIVDKKSFNENSMSAEAWSSGDVKVSNDCRGSLAAVWAKKENGLINVTIAGACGDKVAPSGKNVGEFVVVLSARSTIQKGFDIQTQADVTFWLAKLASVNVEAACCSADAAAHEKTSAAADSGTRELKKNSTVVLQAIMTERERLFSTTKNDFPQKIENHIIVKDAEPSGKDLAEAKRKAKEEKIAAEADAKQKAKEKKLAADAAQKQHEKQLQIAAAEKQKQLEAEQRLADLESKKKLQDEEERLAEAERKQEAEEKEQKAAEKQQKAAEKEQKTAEKEQRAAEKQRKEDENDRIAASEKEQKLAEKHASPGKKQKRDEEQIQIEAKRKLDQEHILQSELSEKQAENSRKNSHVSREDAILAEATRQAELEQTQETNGSTSRSDAILKEATRQAELEQTQGTSGNMTRDDAILAEATRQAELERKEAADMRVPYNASSTTGSNSLLMPSVEIDNEQTALRPTPSLSDLITPATIGQALVTQPTPSPVSEQNEVGSEAVKIASDPIPSREPSKGWESPGLPVNVKQPTAGAMMVLPERAIAGQYITAAVVNNDHNGENGIELGFNGVSLATDSSGQVTFMVPEDAVPGNSLTVAMTANPSARPFAIEVLQPLTTSSQVESPSIDSTSQMVSSNGIVIIDGHNFDGLADHNNVMIDEKTECKVTAASPVQLRVKVPGNLLPGLHFATVNCKQLKSNPGRFSLVTAEVQPDPKEAGKEQVTKLIVKVLGTTNKVQVRLTNQTPNVIKISKGNDLRLTMPGGDDNSTTVSVQRLRKGSYRVGAVVE